MRRSGITRHRNLINVAPLQLGEEVALITSGRSEKSLRVRDFITREHTCREDLNYTGKIRQLRKWANQMRRCAFLTLEDPTGYVIDDELAYAPLAALGWRVDTIPWRGLT